MNTEKAPWERLGPEIKEPVQQKTEDTEKAPWDRLPPQEEYDIDRRIAGVTGAALGTGISAARGIGQTVSQVRAARSARNIEEAKKVAEAAERGRIAAQMAARPPVGPTVAPPSMAPNVERILQGTTEEGATGRARMQGFNTATAQQAAAAKEAEQIIEGLRQKGVVPQGARSVLAGVPGLTSTESGVLIPRSAPAQTIGPRGPQGQMGAGVPRPVPVKPSGLEQVSRLFESMMQSSPVQGLGTVAKYATPPLALGSAMMDISDIMQEEQKTDPDRIRQILSGLGAVGAGMSMFPPTAPIGVPLAIMAPAAQYIREQQKRPQKPSEPGLTAPEAAPYVSP